MSYLNPIAWLQLTSVPNYPTIGYYHDTWLNIIFSTNKLSLHISPLQIFIFPSQKHTHKLHLLPSICCIISNYILSHRWKGP
ncbi:unnamed protein product [Lactuca virosa]|uniref:Uncharacterized protein n=1 Tax=Lactuca virosa TaxID=75947 RepID=A0AAU9MPX7_9ASTR|nr:unnamed protein product [Lactuca virosa]